MFKILRKLKNKIIEMLYPSIHVYSYTELMALGSIRKGEIGEVTTKHFKEREGYTIAKIFVYYKDAEVDQRYVINKEVDVILDKWEVSEHKKKELKQYIQDTRIGIPDFIALTPKGELMFFETKFGKSELTTTQKRVKKELEKKGYDVKVDRVQMLKDKPLDLFKR
jgi:hypothetical protein